MVVACGVAAPLNLEVRSLFLMFLIRNVLHSMSSLIDGIRITVSTKPQPQSLSAAQQILLVFVALNNEVLVVDTFAGLENYRRL
jgi:hypothetical protein